MTSLRGTGTGTASSSSTLTVSSVSGTAAGDLILIFGVAQGSSSTLSTIAGFSSSSNTNSGSINARAYMRTSDGTEGSTFTITLGTSSGVGAAICAVYESPASIDPSAIPAVYIFSGNGTTIPVPSVTLGGSSDWLAWFGGVVNNATTSSVITKPSGFTTQATVAGFNNGTDSAGMIFADLESAQSSGATGTKTGSLSAGSRNAGWLVGVAPSTAGGSGVNSGVLMCAYP